MMTDEFGNGPHELRLVAIAAHARGDFESERITLDKLIQIRMQAIDAAAEAIYIADEDNPEPDWETLPKFGKTHYRKMAAAAYDVLVEAMT